MALERRSLHDRASAATALAEANELRSALLQAVSHDLRTPLAGIKASVNSLRQPDVSWSDDETAEFLATVEDETDRLTALVDNLLDMSRINASALAPTLRATSPRRSSLLRWPVWEHGAARSPWTCQRTCLL